MYLWQRNLKNRAEMGTSGTCGSRHTQRGEQKAAASSTRDGAPRSTARAAGGKAASGGERVIRYKTCLRNTIGDVLRTRGWQEVKEGEGEWDFYWCDVAWMREHFDLIYLEEHQRVCHFRNHYELTRYLRSSSSTIIAAQPPGFLYT